jgi:DNA-binding NtrC family response regulator
MPRPTNALIVDDEPHVRTFLRLMLRQLGITECWETGDGLSALEMIQTLKPQLVLLDINLPKLGGMELLTKLHEAESTTPVIMVTSQGAVTTVSEAMRLGAVGFVLKHSPKDETMEMLRDALDSLEDNEGGEASA